MPFVKLLGDDKESSRDAKIDGVQNGRIKMSNYKIVTNDELKHYGIKGMKWHKRKRRVMLKSNYDRLWRARKRNGVANSIDQFFNSYPLGGGPRVIPDPPKINNAMERRITRGDAARSKTNQGIRDRRQQLHDIRRKEYAGYRIKDDISTVAAKWKSGVYQKKAKKAISKITKSLTRKVSSVSNYASTKAKTTVRRFLSGLLF